MWYHAYHRATSTQQWIKSGPWLFFNKTTLIITEPFLSPDLFTLWCQYRLSNRLYHLLYHLVIISLVASWFPLVQYSGTDFDDYIMLLDEKKCKVISFSNKQLILNYIRYIFLSFNDHDTKYFIVFIYFGRKGSAVTGSELRNIINEYVRKNNLQDEKNKR